MKTKYYKIGLIFLIFIVTSCSREEYLDIKPKGILIPQTIEDFRLLLDNASSGGESFGVTLKHSLNIFQAGDIEITDELADDFGFAQSEINTYLFQEQIFPSPNDDASWEGYYNLILTTNIILDGLLEITDKADANEAAKLIAEAKLHRAYAYFNLVNLYGLHYNESTATTDLGVPIREGSGLEDIDLTRANVQQVYDLILNDVTSSIDQLDDVQDLNLTHRPSKAGAYGFLAKIYIYQGKYDLALTALTNAINLKNDLRNIFDDDFDFQSGARLLPRPVLDPEIVWHKQDFHFLFPSQELLNLYEFGDLRSDWYVPASSTPLGLTVDTPLMIAKFINSNFSKGINTPDLYLMRAECHARLNNITEANNDINTLRESRFLAPLYTPINITDQNELIQYVKDERRRELPGNGERTFDIKRYNLYDNDNISVTHTLRGNTAMLNPNSKNWALPIASKYILLNPEIEQNPRD